MARARAHAEAFQHLLENFSGGEVPVDFDHAGEEGGSTRAGAWVERLWVDDSKGLMVLKTDPIWTKISRFGHP